MRVGTCAGTLPGLGASRALVRWVSKAVVNKEEAGGLTVGRGEARLARCRWQVWKRRGRRRQFEWEYRAHRGPRPRPDLRRNRVRTRPARAGRHLARDGVAGGGGVHRKTSWLWVDGQTRGRAKSDTGTHAGDLLKRWCGSGGSEKG